ncbi:MAG: peptidoglycan editing factor PgeF [Pseudomonadota bacterium]
MTAKPWIEPRWPAPPNVHACSTLRRGGVSKASWASLNLGGHVNDDSSHVAENRRRLMTQAGLPEEPRWLTQVHGCDVVDNSILDDACLPQPPQADAAYSNLEKRVCAVLTADCLPVLFVDAEGREVAAAHAGWRGLAAGVLEQTIGRFSTAPDALLAWLGPAIGPESFEVGEDVRDAFTAWNSACETAFVAHREGRWLADIYQLASLRLRHAGVTEIHGGGYCTYSDAERFFSYRRDGETGRMATLIWFDG